MKTEMTTKEAVPKKGTITDIKKVYPEAVPIERVLNSKVNIWWFLNDAKVLAVKRGFTRDQLVALKQECDSLFFQVTGCPIHPAWWTGGWGA